MRVVPLESNAAGLVLRLALKTRFSEMGWGSTPLLSAIHMPTVSRSDSLELRVGRPHMRFESFVGICMVKKLWRLWAKALGEKVGDDATADRVAVIRTIIVLSYITTNCVIIAGVWRHW